MKPTYEQLEQERNELAAQVERLQSSLNEIAWSWREEHGVNDGVYQDLMDALSETPPAALAALKAQWQADNADLVRLALELCDAVENNDNLTPVKFALRCGRLVNSIRQRAQEAGDA